MSFSSEKSSRQTTSTSLPRQDTATTESSLSTSCSNLETNESTISSTTSTTRRPKNKTKRKSRIRREHSIEHFIPSGDAKTLKTLKIHYYPEEQIWGLVIVITATSVHVINHGLHLAYGTFLITITRSFNRVALTYAGEF